MAKKKSLDAPTIQNRKARHNYTIQDEIEAGIMLTGTEVKSLRQGKANLNDAYAAQKGNEMELINSYIAVYENANRFNHAERRPRKLLLHRRQINKLIGMLKRDGITIVPLSLYFNDAGIAKIKIGIAKGKKQHDKREDAKQRDWQREKARTMKHNV